MSEEERKEADEEVYIECEEYGENGNRRKKEERRMRIIRNKRKERHKGNRETR